jgi:hypothetical protein
VRESRSDGVDLGRLGGRKKRERRRRRRKGRRTREKGKGISEGNQREVVSRGRRGEEERRGERIPSQFWLMR